MGCGTDGGSCGTVGGCGSSGSCGTGGCNRLNVFDWLNDMGDSVPLSQQYNLVEVRFKGGRKEFFSNPNHLELFSGDPVVVEVPSGHHVGFVSLQGELVRLQMLRKNVPVDENIKQIYRKANEKDLEKYEQSKAKELTTLYRTREIANELKLNMKLSDIEYQADSSKATFYYSAEDRVDFRELIKTLATEFKIRVEMKQISLRQEASRLGGIGVCGRELCCSTWLTEYKNVSTAAARYQNLSLNPAKLSGQCGRLKCCLNYELDTYMDAIKDIPNVETPIKTVKGKATLQKTDIFRRIMWFSYQDETNWFPVSVDQVVKLLELNAQGIIPEGLTEEEEFEETEAEKETKGAKDELLRLDKKYSIASGSGKKKKKKKKGTSVQDENRNGGAVLGQTSRPQHIRTNENSSISQRANANTKPATASFAPRDNSTKKSEPFEGRDGNQPLKRSNFSQREVPVPTINPVNTSTSDKINAREAVNNEPKKTENFVKREAPKQNVNEPKKSDSFVPRQANNNNPAPQRDERKDDKFRKPFVKNDAPRNEENKPKPNSQTSQSQEPRENKPFVRQRFNVAEGSDVQDNTPKPKPEQPIQAPKPVENKDNKPAGNQGSIPPRSPFNQNENSGSSFIKPRNRTNNEE